MFGRQINKIPSASTKDKYNGWNVDYALLRDMKDDIESSENSHNYISLSIEEIEAVILELKKRNYVLL